jgi:ferredoxin-NADP reductase
VPDISTPIFYVSGPEPMVNGISDKLKGMGVPENHIKGDWFPGYEQQ